MAFSQQVADEICRRLAEGESLRRATIYGLAHPETGEIRYVGKARDAKARLLTHMRERRRRTPLYDWIESLRRVGLAPRMVELASAFDWQAIERAIIAQARADGWRLLNIADGGDQPTCSKEQCAKNAERVNADRHTNPVAYANHSLLRSAGQLLRYSRGAFSSEKHARLSATVANLKSLAANNPEELFARIVSNDRLRARHLEVAFEFRP